MKTLYYFLICCALMGNLMATTGSTHLENCKAFVRATDLEALEGDEISAGTCSGYLQGVLDSNGMWQQITESKGAYCLPESEEYFDVFTQAVKVVVKYLEDNPAELHKNAAFPILMALSDAFPCEE